MRRLLVCLVAICAPATAFAEDICYRPPAAVDPLGALGGVGARPSCNFGNYLDRPAWDSIQVTPQTVCSDMPLGARAGWVDSYLYVPKIANDHRGSTDLVYLAAHVDSDTGQSVTLVYRNGSYVGQVWGDKWGNNGFWGMHDTVTGMIISRIIGRPDVAAKMAKGHVECISAAHFPPYNSSCLTCEVTKYAAYGGLGFLAYKTAAVTLPYCALNAGKCAAAGAALVALVENTLGELCDYQCDLEKCDDKYKKCTDMISNGGGGSVRPNLPHDPPENETPAQKCYREYRECVEEVRKKYE